MCHTCVCLDVTLASVLKDQTLFQQVLLKNFSLSNATTGLLLHTPVSLTGVTTPLLPLHVCLCLPEAEAVCASHLCFCVQVRSLLLETRGGGRNQSLKLAPGGSALQVRRLRLWLDQQVVLQVRIHSPVGSAGRGVITEPHIFQPMRTCRGCPDMFCVVTVPHQEGASAGVEGLKGGLLHEALRDPAEAAGSRTLPRGTSGALGRSDRPEDQRKDQQALKDLEV